MHYNRMTIEAEAPEEIGAAIKYNLSESAISDQTVRSLGIEIPPEIVLTYTEHRGSIKIRTLIAEASNGALGSNDVLVTAGASTSLFIVMTALLGPRDHIVITRPNYATNLEVPRSIGCDITFVDLDFESQFRLDLDRIATAIRPGVTKIISICSPNNPTGTVCSFEELRALATLAKKEGCFLLIDETYWDLNYELCSIAGDELNKSGGACLGDHVITVSSMSKAYGVPGIRIGWLTTTNGVLQEMFLAAKEQISICGSVFDELAAEQILSRRAEILPKTIAHMQRRRQFVDNWVKRESDFVEWVTPEAGAMGFIRLKRKTAGETADFYKKLLEEHGVYVGRGSWFESDDSFFRLGYGWPTWDDLEAGLEAISKALQAS